MSSSSAVLYTRSCGWNHFMRFLHFLFFFLHALVSTSRGLADWPFQKTSFHFPCYSVPLLFKTCGNSSLLPSRSSSAQRPHTSENPTRDCYLFYLVSARFHLSGDSIFTYSWWLCLEQTTFDCCRRRWAPFSTSQFSASFLHVQTPFLLRPLRLSFYYSFTVYETHPSQRIWLLIILTALKQRRLLIKKLTIFSLRSV